MGLDAEGRAENVRDAFQWQGDSIPLRALLVDDVCTTGSTLSECASVLKQCGSTYVFAVTVGKAAGHGPDADL